MLKNTYLFLLFLSVGMYLDKLNATPKTSSNKAKITTSKTLSSQTRKNKTKRNSGRAQRRAHHPIKKINQSTTALGTLGKSTNPLLKTALVVAAKKRAQQQRQQYASAKPTGSQSQKRISRPAQKHSVQATPQRVRKRALATRVTTTSQPLKEKEQSEALFIWPLKIDEFWISSFFGPRKNPNGTLGFHAGLDLAACKGTLVYAVGEGTVEEATYIAGYGNYILLEHNEEYKTRYAHLDKICVKPGQTVLCGDVIGKVGATGTVRKTRKNGSGSHLHFEVYKQNKRVNPLYFLA